LNSEMTFYVFSGDYIAYIATFFLSLFCGYILIKKRRVM